MNPKELLYTEAYDPLVLEWFRRLDASPALSTTWQETKGQDLLPTVLVFNGLFHALVDEQFVDQSPATKHAIEVVGQYADHVVWAGQCEPPRNPSNEDIKVSLKHKVKRNVSLAFQEGLVVVGSGANFLRGEQARTDKIPQILRRSYRLIGSLAVLNDTHEQTRIKELLGSHDGLSYPQTPFSEITSGVIQISSDQFEWVAAIEDQSLRFKATQQATETPLDTTMRCPAHRLKFNGIRLNETFWNMLIDMHDKSGQFSQASAGYGPVS